MKVRPDLEDTEHWSSPNGCHPDCPACAAELYTGPVEGGDGIFKGDVCIAIVKDYDALKLIAGIKALELMRRGLESGVFDDAPVFKKDVKKLLKGK